MTAGLGELAARLARLEDERAVLFVLHRYAHSLDYGENDQWVDCFTESGVFDVRRREPPGLRHVGADELRTFVKSHTNAPERYHKHLLIEPIIEIEGDYARAESYFARIDAIGEQPTLTSFGRYRDQLMRCADAKWRFTERIIEVEARTIVR